MQHSVIQIPLVKELAERDSCSDTVLGAMMGESEISLTSQDFDS